MSATKDPGTRIRFVYQNLYQIFKDDPLNWGEDESPLGIQTPVVPSSGRVLKTGEAQKSALIARYQPSTLQKPSLEVRPGTRVKHPPAPAQTGQVERFRATSQLALSDIQKLSQPLEETLSFIEDSLKKAQLIEEKIRTVVSDLKEFTGKRRSGVRFSDE